jgi:hypothetical protein
MRVGWVLEALKHQRLRLSRIDNEGMDPYDFQVYTIYCLAAIKATDNPEPNGDETRPKNVALLYYTLHEMRPDSEGKNEWKIIE